MNQNELPIVTLDNLERASKLYRETGKLCFAVSEWFDCKNGSLITWQQFIGHQKVLPQLVLGIS